MQSPSKTESNPFEDKLPKTPELAELGRLLRAFRKATKTSVRGVIRRDDGKPYSHGQISEAERGLKLPSYDLVDSYVQQFNASRAILGAAYEAARESMERLKSRMKAQLGDQEIEIEGREDSFDVKVGGHVVYARTILALRALQPNARTFQFQPHYLPKEASQNADIILEPGEGWELRHNSDGSVLGKLHGPLASRGLVHVALMVSIYFPRPIIAETACLQFTADRPLKRYAARGELKVEPANIRLFQGTSEGPIEPVRLNQSPYGGGFYYFELRNVAAGDYCGVEWKTTPLPVFSL